MFDRVTRTTKSVYSGVLDLIYPPFCLVCEKPGEHFLCADCIEQIDTIEPPCCRKCGLPTDHLYCPECELREFAFESARSAGVFDGVLRNAIHEFKFRFHLGLADPLSELMVRCFPNTYLAGKADIVVPVPIHHSRLVERGFNQAIELSRRFCKRVSLPMETSALYRVKRTKHQVNLPYDQRATNIEGAFAVKDAGKIAGKRVLLIDDVFTTGATLNEAAKVLREAGASAIYAYTLARSL